MSSFPTETSTTVHRKGKNTQKNGETGGELSDLSAQAGIDDGDVAAFARRAGIGPQVSEVGGNPKECFAPVSVALVDGWLAAWWRVGLWPIAGVEC